MMRVRAHAHASASRAATTSRNQTRKTQENAFVARGARECRGQARAVAERSPHRLILSRTRRVSSQGGGVARAADLCDVRCARCIVDGQSSH